MSHLENDVSAIKRLKPDKVEFKLPHTFGTFHWNPGYGFLCDKWEKKFEQILNFNICQNASVLFLFFGSFSGLGFSNKSKRVSV